MHRLSCISDSNTSELVRCKVLFVSVTRFLAICARSWCCVFLPVKISQSFSITHVHAKLCQVHNKAKGTERTLHVCDNNTRETSLMPQQTRRHHCICDRAALPAAIRPGIGMCRHTLAQVCVCVYACGCVHVYGRAYRAWAQSKYLYLTGEVCTCAAGFRKQQHSSSQTPLLAQAEDLEPAFKGRLT